MNPPYAIPAFAGLAEAMAAAAALAGVSVSAAGIKHGLAIENGKLSPVAYAEAASRAGFTLVSCRLGDLTSESCPAAVLLRDGRVSIVTAVKPGQVCSLLHADKSEAIALIGHLDAAGVSACWSLRPTAKRDARTAADELDTGAWLRSQLTIGRRTLKPLVAATVTINLLALAIPLISMNVLDRVVSHAAFDTLWALTLAGLLAVAADLTLRTLRGSLVDKASARTDVLLSNAIFSRILGAKLLPKRPFVGVQVNSIREYESIREIYNSATLTTMGDLPFALLFFFAIWLVAGPLVIVPLAVSPLLLAAGLFSHWRLSKLSAEHLKDAAHKNSVAIEVMTGIETVKSHGAESWAAYKWEKAVADHLRHSIEMRWWTALGGNLILALQGLTTLAILVVGVYLVVGQTISPGALFAATMLAGRSLSPVAQVATLLSKIHQARSAYKAVLQLVDVEQERPAGRRFLSTAGKLGPIVLDSIELAYAKDSPPALRIATLRIEPGEKVGIMGGIGSGKSSLLQLILGLRAPTSGSITMSGIPIQELDPSDYRRLFGTVFQDEAFFFGTLHDNISFASPELTDTDVVRAATLSGALDWIKTLPAGFATIVTEGGKNLSNGQRQTLALARAFLGQPAALLLDEPSSNMDPRSEAELLKKLKSLEAERTLIVVSHRPALLDACNRLIVMDSGQVLLDGEKAIVLARLRQAMNSQRAASGGPA